MGSNKLILNSKNFKTGSVLSWIVVGVSGALITSCASKAPDKKPKQNVDASGYKIDPVVSPSATEAKPHISNVTKFSSQEFGVKGSPRVTNEKQVRKGGGRYQIGKPYTIRGKRYYPKLDKNLKQVGNASWYGPNFHGRLTANGEIYDQYALSAAHPTMPLPSYAKVTNVENGRSVTVRVNDRGPYSRGRVIDLSAQAAKMLDYTHQGVAKVRVEYIGKAKMDGLDSEMLLASYNGPTLPDDKLPPNYSKQSSILVVNAQIQKQKQLDSVSVNNGPIPQGTTGLIQIENTFTQDLNRVVPLADVPVPQTSPGVFENSGVSEAVYQVQRKPLAFTSSVEISPPKYTLYKKHITNKNNNLNSFSNKMVEINVGLFSTVLDMLHLKKFLDEPVSIKANQNRLLLSLPENEANIMLDYLRVLGIDGSYIL